MTAEICNGKCAVGDSGNLQRQVRSWGQQKLATVSASWGQRKLATASAQWGQQKLATASADARQVRGWGCGMDWVRGGFLRGSHQA
jgi:hypothetical protein